jgi:hypothetical protein
MYLFERKIIINKLFAVKLIISSITMTAVAEASYNDIVLDLFNTRSPINSSLLHFKHHLHDIYFVSKGGINFNAIKPSSTTSGQIVSTSETGIIQFINLSIDKISIN